MTKMCRRLNALLVLISALCQTSFASQQSDWTFTHTMTVGDAGDEGINIRKSVSGGAWNAVASSKVKHSSISVTPGQKDKLFKVGLHPTAGTPSDVSTDPKYAITFKPDGTAWAKGVDGIMVDLSIYIGGDYKTSDEFTVTKWGHRMVVLHNGREVHNWGSCQGCPDLHAKLVFFTSNARANNVYFGFSDAEPTLKPGRFCWKDSYGRGIGTIPNRCPSHKVKIGALCYDKCPSGYKRWGFDCHGVCPSGWTNDGLFCRKKTYGRGAGFPWKFGDALNLNAAKRRCENKHGSGKCEKWGEIYYPKCRSGYRNAGCCICEPTEVKCGDYSQLGGKIFNSCAKKVKIGNASSMLCPTDKEYDAGLCYKKCRSGFDGVGPVCWGQPPPGWVQCGMGAAKNSYECADAVGSQVWSVGEVALFVGTVGASSAGTTAAKGAKVAAKTASNASKWAKMRKSLKAMMDAHPRLMKAMNDGSMLAHYGFTTADIMTEEGVTEEDAVRLIATMASLFDPTGVSSVIEAYTWPKCSKLFNSVPEAPEVPNHWVPSTDFIMDTVFDHIGGDKRYPIGKAAALGFNARSFTASAWVYRTGRDSGDNTIFGMNEKSTNKGLHLLVRNKKYYMGFYRNDCGSDTLSTLNNWEQIVFRYKLESKQMTMYLNGLPIKTCSNKDWFKGTGTVYIGDSTYGSFRGQIRNIKIYQRWLTNAEVLEQYNNEQGIGLITPPKPIWSQSYGKADDATNKRLSNEVYGKKTSWPDKVGRASTYKINTEQWTVSAWVYRSGDKNSGDMAILGTDTFNTNEGLTLMVRGDYYRMGFYGSSCYKSSHKNDRYKWRYVTFQYDHAYMRIFENAVLVKECSGMPQFVGTSDLQMGGALKAKKWKGAIRDLKIWDTALDQTQIEEAYYELYDGDGETISRGEHIATIEPSYEYELSLLIEPKGKVSSQANILHISKNGVDCCDAGTRVPYISFYPDSTRLRVLTSCGNPWNKQCNPPSALPEDTFTEFRMRVASQKIMVWINGQLENECDCPNMYRHQPAGNANAHVYLSDPWSTQAKVEVRKVIYRPLGGQYTVQDVTDRSDKTIDEDYQAALDEVVLHDICDSPDKQTNYGATTGTYFPITGLTYDECKYTVGSRDGKQGGLVVYAVFHDTLCKTFTDYKAGNTYKWPGVVDGAFEICGTNPNGEGVGDSWQAQLAASNAAAQAEVKKKINNIKKLISKNRVWGGRRLETEDAEEIPAPQAIYNDFEEEDSLFTRLTNLFF